MGQDDGVCQSKGDCNKCSKSMRMMVPPVLKVSVSLKFFKLFFFQYPRQIKSMKFDPGFAIRGLHFDTRKVSNCCCFALVCLFALLYVC